MAFWIISICGLLLIGGLLWMRSGAGKRLAVLTADENRARFNKEEVEGAQTVRVITGVCAGITAVLLFFYILLNGLVEVESGKIKQAKLFGGIQDGVYYTEGLNWVPPWYELIEVDIRTRLLEFHGPDTLSAVSGDNVFMETFDLNVPYRIVEQHASAVLREIGTSYEDKIIRPAARSAARKVLGRTNWADAATKKQDEFAIAILTEMENQVSNMLESQGVSPEIAQNAFTFSEPGVRKLMPPEAVRDAGAERQAAVIERERQIELTKAQEEIANRQGMEGLGVKNLFFEMGLDTSEMSPDDIAKIIRVLSVKQQADVFDRLVRGENSKNIQWGVVMGGSGTPDIAVDPMPSAPLPAVPVAE